jgi:uncharacterized protein (TIGR02594 family)
MRSVLFTTLATLLMLTLQSNPLFAQSFPAPGGFPTAGSMNDFPDDVIENPDTAMSLEPTDEPTPEPDADVPAAPNYDPPQEPFFPELPETGANYEGPVGVTGIFNGNVTTGCSYDPLSHSAHREITDIVVAGSIGKYPLKMTRYYNSRQQYYATPGAIGLSPGWAHEYSWLLWAAGHKVVSPRGNVHDDFCGAPVGVSEGWDGGGIWRLADGGKVHFSGGYADWIEDPYGFRTTITYNQNTGLRTRVTEPGGRYLAFYYNDTDQDGTKLLTRVEAHGLGNATVTDWVEYTYREYSPGVQGRAPKKMLRRVNYSDGTHAVYDYRSDNVTESPTSHKMYPLLQRCDDVRYNGPMRTIRYEYQNGFPHGFIINEKKPGIGVVSAISPTGPDTFTETRGDGPTRTFTYSHIHHCQGNECGPCDDEGTNGPNQQMLLSYTDFHGHTTVLDYDANWYVNSVTDANQHLTTYERGPPPPNGIGEIKKIIHHPDNSFIQYTYSDWGHYIMSIRDENGKTTSITRDARHRITRIDYPSDANTPASHEEFTYCEQADSQCNNTFGQIKRHRLKNGAYVHYRYNSRGLLVDKWEPTWNANLDGADPKTHYDYYGANDPVGGNAWVDRLKKTTMPMNWVGNVAFDKYEYDRDASNNPVPGRGLVTKITHADNRSQAFRYNQYGNKVYEWNEMGERTDYVYDNYNRVISVTRRMNPGPNETTTYTYNPTNGGGSPYLHTTNNSDTITSPTGIVTTNVYDQNFRKKSTSVAGRTTWFHYDNVGNQDYVTDPRGTGSGDPRFTTYSDYDERNRKWRVREPLGHTTAFRFDLAGNVRYIDRPDGTTEEKTYDAMNRVLKHIVPKDNSATITTESHYNPSGTLEWVKDGEDRQYRFEYDDPSDLRTKMIYPNGDSRRWQYDGAHNLGARSTVNGQIQFLAYDARNRKYFEFWDGFPENADWRYFSYDGANRLRRASNGTGVWPNNIISDVHRDYDTAGRLKLDQQAVTGAGTVNVNYSHDADGRTTRLWVSGGNYDYTFEYDAMGRFEKIYLTGNNNIQFQYYYDDASNETQRFNWINRVAQIYSPDELKRIGSVEVKNTNSNTRFSLETYDYDGMNRITSITRENGRADSFTYFKNGELNVAHYNNNTRNVTYNLDKAGNRQTVTDNGSPTTYTPNTINQYTGATGGVITNGNEHEISDYETLHYTYIKDEHLQSVSNGNNSYELAYDALGRCVKRSLRINGQTVMAICFIYDGEKPILEYNQDGQIMRNVYGKGIDEILQRTDPNVNGGQAFYFQQDHEGSVTLLTNRNNGSGQVIEKYKYDAFGAPTIYPPQPNATPIPVSSFNNRFLFTGREYAATYNVALKFYEYRARAYHPGLGRFMSEDPKLFDAGDYNLFRYCHNDPINFTDPMGLDVAGPAPTSSMERLWNFAKWFDRSNLDHGNFGWKDVPYQLSPAKPQELLRIARGQLGVKEIPGRESNSRIIDYLKTTTIDAKAHNDSTAWCSAFANWVVTQGGLRGTNSAAAVSWRRWGEDAHGPAFGAIAVIDHRNGRGHVGFVAGVTTSGRVILLGGNQRDAVRYSVFGTSKMVSYRVPSGSYNGFPVMRSVVPAPVYRDTGTSALEYDATR